MKSEHPWGIWKKVIVSLIIQGVVQTILGAMYDAPAKSFPIVLLGANLTMVCADLIAVGVALYLSLVILAKKFVVADIEDMSRTLTAASLALVLVGTIWSMIFGDAYFYGPTQLLSNGLSIVFIYFETRFVLSRQFRTQTG